MTNAWPLQQYLHFSFSFDLIGTIAPQQAAQSAAYKEAGLSMKQEGASGLASAGRWLCRYWCRCVACACPVLWRVVWPYGKLGIN